MATYEQIKNRRNKLFNEERKLRASLEKEFSELFEGNISLAQINIENYKIRIKAVEYLLQNNIFEPNFLPEWQILKAVINKPDLRARKTGTLSDSLRYDGLIRIGVLSTKIPYGYSINSAEMANKWLEFMKKIIRV